MQYSGQHRHSSSGLQQPWTHSTQLELHVELEQLLPANLLCHCIYTWSIICVQSAIDMWGASIGWWSCYTAKTITRAGYSACFQSDQCAFLFPSACHISVTTSQGGQTMTAACSNSCNHHACPSAATTGPIGPSANTAWDVGERGSGVGHRLGGLNARGVDSPDLCNCKTISQRLPSQKCRTARRFFQPLYQGMGHTNGLAVCATPGDVAMCRNPKQQIVECSWFPHALEGSFGSTNKTNNATNRLA